MKLRDVIYEGDIIKFLKGFLSGNAGGSETVKDLDKLLKVPMPGHEEMTKADYIDKVLLKGKVKF